MTAPMPETPAAPNLGRIIAAVCLHPRLRSLLVFDSTPHGLRAMAGQMAERLASVVGAPVEVRAPSTALDDDGLWGLSCPGVRRAAWSAAPAPAPWRLLDHSGVLLPAVDSPAWLILLLPDLTRIGPALVRAAYQLIGTETIHLERYGCSAQLPNRIVWLAGCPRSASHQVPRHLLDRFAVQINDPTPVPDRRAILLGALTEAATPFAAPKPTAVAELVPTALPGLSQAASQRLQAYIAGSFGQSTSMHRDLALARLATALAALDGAAAVEAAHLDEAIKILALRTGQGSAAGDPLSDSAAGQAPPSTQTGGGIPASAPPSTNQAGSGGTPGQPGSEARSVDAEAPSDAHRLPPLAGEAASTSAPQAGAAAALAFPALIHRVPSSQAAGKGEVVGVRLARPGEPIAILPTLLAAAPWQGLRHRQSPGLGARLLVERTDLRHWRRADRPSAPLLLLLDLTAVRDHDWTPAVARALADAYQSRAPVSLILVGAEQAKGPAEARAERIDCRNILVPRLRAALDRKAGRATPLADGLRLVREDLKTLVQPHPNLKDRPWLVIITDGRGNIPLKTSVAGEPIWPVGRLGIDDALDEARQIAALGRARIALFAPEPRFAAHILDALAVALGVDCIRWLPLKGTEEVA